MTKSLSGDMIGHDDQEVTTKCTMMKLIRADGQTFGFTGFNEDITYGGIVFSAETAYSPSAVETSSGLSVDNLEVQGILDSDTITEADIIAGLWDHCEVEIFQINWADLSMGLEYKRRGHIGEIKFGKAGFFAELRGLTQAYQQEIGDVYKVACDADFGDDRCTIDIDLWTVTGTITSVLYNRTFTDSSRAEDVNWFQGGKITWTTGLNTGLSMEVQAFAAGQFILSIPMPYDVAIGDEYSVYRGCDKTLATCTDVFANVINFRGFPYIPGLDRLASGE